MLALLLFLVCALAGAAAVTAAGSNVGRYSYVEEDRQQFLTVTSAAKLIRDELNGLSVTGEYTYEAKEFEAVNPVEIVATDGEVTKQYTFEKEGDKDFNIDEKDNLGHFFKEDLIKMVDSAFYDFIKEYPSHNDNGLWQEIPNEIIKSNEEIVGKYAFTVDCITNSSDDKNPFKLKTEDGSDLTLNIELTIEDPNDSYNDNKDFMIKLSYGEIVYSIKGKIDITADDTNDEKIVKEAPFTPEPSASDPFPEEIVVSAETFYKSTQKTKVTFNFTDPFVREDKS